MKGFKRQPWDKVDGLKYYALQKKEEIESKVLYALHTLFLDLID